MEEITWFQLIAGLAPWAAMGSMLGSIVSFVDNTARRERLPRMRDRLWHWLWYRWKIFSMVWLAVILMNIMAASR